MLRWLTKLWRWFKGLFVRNRPAATVPSLRLTLSNLEYENTLMALLEEAEQGKSWSNLQALLVLHRLTPEVLAQWLKEHSSRWIEQPEQYQEFARRLVMLAQVASGELATVAHAIGMQIQVNATLPFPSESSAFAKITPAVEESEETGAEESGVAVEEAWQRANAQYEAGDYEAVIASFEQVLKLKPDDGLALRKRGFAFSELGRYEEAIASHEQALKLKPDDDQAWDNRGLALNNLKRFQEALESAERGIVLQPEKGHGWYVKGYALDGLGRYEEALFSYEQALKLQPDDYQAWYNRALAFGNLGRDEEALASYEQALKLQPDYCYAWFSRGNTLSKLGRYEEALISYEQALKLKPDDYQAWGNRGNMLSHLGRYEEAVASYKQVLKLKPDYSAYYLTLRHRGFALAELGRYEEALASHEQALKLQPDYYQAWAGRGFALAELGRHEEALASYEQVLKLKPDVYLAWLSRGIALFELRRYEESLTSYEQALKLEPDDYMSWYNRGITLSDLGRHEEALASYEQALKLKPDDYQAWFSRGNALFELRRYEEAIANREQALKLKPDYYQAWGNRGFAALNSSHYNPSYQQQFAYYFSSSCAQIPQRIQFNPLNATEAQALLQASWNTSQQLLVETFSSQQAPDALLEVIQQPLPPDLAELLQQPPSPDLLELTRQPPSATVLDCIHQDSLHHASLYNSLLQQRGYLGELASYQAELDKAIGRKTHPEGWGHLHYQIGRAHYRQARRVSSPTALWRQAEKSFKAALQVLQPPQFEELYLEVVQDLVRALLDLHETAEATELQRRGTDLLQRMLDDPQRSTRQKRSLALKFAGFEQLTVNLVLQQGDSKGALSLAETSKNTCLRWLLGIDEIPTVHYDDMQNLCDTAATPLLYWHLSSIALTTFLLLPNSKEPLLISPPAEFPSGYEIASEVSGQTDERSPSLRQLLTWEKWLTQWNQDYADYSSPKEQKGSNQSSAWKKTHPWRSGMVQKLADLKVILNGSAVEQILVGRGIKQMILIPHRDLHRFPLHYLFDAYNCTYFPSAHLALVHHQLRSPSIQLDSLLLIENPRSTPLLSKTKKLLEPLPFAEAESALIQQLIGSAVSERQPTVKVVASQDATLSTTTVALKRPHQILHFTGHGTYDSLDPSQSCLFLAGSDRLTLLEIVRLDLSAYRLVCLAACETAVTGDQTITAEYVGLVSAFLKAGVGHVVSTLWRVESVTSMITMVQFYRELQHQPPVSALKAAQAFLRNGTRDQFVTWFDEAIALLSTTPANRSFCILLTAERDRLQSIEEEHPYAHPYYWAAFYIAGAI